jgi:hypothetical protein
MKETSGGLGTGGWWKRGKKEAAGERQEAKGCGEAAKKGSERKEKVVR